MASLPFLLMLNLRSKRVACSKETVFLVGIRIVDSQSGDFPKMPVYINTHISPTLTPTSFLFSNSFCIRHVCMYVFGIQFLVFCDSSLPWFL